MKPRYRVAVVEDHRIVREGLVRLLEDDPDFTVVCQAGNEAKAWRVICAERPDVILMDLFLKESDVFDLIHRIKAELHIPVLILSMHNENVYAERALRAGAAGYIMKNEAAEQVAEALREVLNGRVYLSQSMQQHFLQGVSGHRVESTESDSVGQLSDRELLVFRLIGRGRGITEIAESLNLSPKTIETYQGRIRIKLKFGSASELRKQAIAWIWQEEVI